MTTENIRGISNIETVQPLNTIVPNNILADLKTAKKILDDIKAKHKKERAADEAQFKRNGSVNYIIDAEINASNRIEKEILGLYIPIFNFYFSPKNSKELINKGIQIIFEFEHPFFINVRVYNVFRGAIDLAIDYCDEDSEDKIKLENLKNTANYNFVTIYDIKAKFESQQYRLTYHKTNTNSIHLSKTQKIQLEDLIEIHRINIENLKRVIDDYKNNPNTRIYNILTRLLANAYEYLADDEFFCCGGLDKKSDNYFLDKIDLLLTLKYYYTESNLLVPSNLIVFSIINMNDEILKLYTECEEDKKNSAAYLTEIDTILDEIKTLEIDYTKWLNPRTNANEIDLAIESIGYILDFYKKRYNAAPVDNRQKYTAEISTILTTIQTVILEKQRKAKQFNISTSQREKLVTLLQTSSEFFNIGEFNDEKSNLDNYQKSGQEPKRKPNKTAYPTKKQDKSATNHQGTFDNTPTINSNNNTHTPHMQLRNRSQ